MDGSALSSTHTSVLRALVVPHTSHTSHTSPQVETARLSTDCFGQDGKKMVPEKLLGGENVDPNPRTDRGGCAG